MAHAQGNEARTIYTALATTQKEFLRPSTTKNNMTTKSTESAATGRRNDRIYNLLMQNGIPSSAYNLRKQLLFSDHQRY